MLHRHERASKRISPAGSLAGDFFAPFQEQEATIQEQGATIQEQEVMLRLMW